MRSRGLPMLLIAVVAGLAAVVFAARWLQEQGGERGQIAVAAAEIELGGKLTPDQIRMVDWPQASVPPGAFTDGSKLDGRVVISSVHRGEPILESRLAPEGTKGGLSAVVSPGKRAMAVRVNDVVGVAGFALPGTYVDIMVNTQSDNGPRNGDRSFSKIVLERILVLAVGTEADRDNTKPKAVTAVTLELSPKEAEVLDLARSVGTLSLVLRNQTESQLADTSGATKDELLGIKPPAPAASAASSAAAAPPRPAPRRVAAKPPEPKAVAVAAPPRPVNCVEVIRGMSRVVECF